MSEGPSKRTTTQNFGSSRRESHDATDFYARFVPPDISDDDKIEQPKLIDSILNEDARTISSFVQPNSVGLVVTSPPYFAGKEYEETLGENGVPGSYFEYLELLRDVFAECKEVLEPGGRIAINVANLGRRPYRSLASDVTTILQDLGFLMRGEVIWWKGRAAGGSCAWGTFQRPKNPVMRDVTERILIASKGRFDRAMAPKQRLKAGFPSMATITRDEFLEATTDLWEMSPASATQVGHPAPFPVELPKRLIELFTYEGDVVLDPFMGAGTTALAAIQTDRKFLGFETDASYIDRAMERIETERLAMSGASAKTPSTRVQLPAVKLAEPEVLHEDEDFQAVALREGRQAKYLAEQLLEHVGFKDIQTNKKRNDLGVEVNFGASDKTGSGWLFDVYGAFTTSRSGLRRTDTLWKALGKASVLHAAGATQDTPLILLTTDVPAKGSAGHKALQAVVGPGKPIFDIIEILDPEAQDRLADYAKSGRPTE